MSIERELDNKFHFYANCFYLRFGKQPKHILLSRDIYRTLLESRFSAPMNAVDSMQSSKYFNGKPIIVLTGCDPDYIGVSGDLLPDSYLSDLLGTYKRSYLYGSSERLKANKLFFHENAKRIETVDFGINHAIVFDATTLSSAVKNNENIKNEIPSILAKFYISKMPDDPFLTVNKDDPNFKGMIAGMRQLEKSHDDPEDFRFKNIALEKLCADLGRIKVNRPSAVARCIPIVPMFEERQGFYDHIRVRQQKEKNKSWETTVFNSIVGSLYSEPLPEEALNCESIQDLIERDYDNQVKNRSRTKLITKKDCDPLDLTVKKQIDIFPFQLCIGDNVIALNPLISENYCANFKIIDTMHLLMSNISIAISSHENIFSMENLEGFLREIIQKEMNKTQFKDINFRRFLEYYRLA